jgi:bleomycin hydrolase
MKLLQYTLIPVLLMCVTALCAQLPINTNKKGGGYTFKISKMIEATPVKNQYKSGTCWVFSTNSFIESEIMRLGNGKVDLSEMYVVRNLYIQKAEHYMRYQGHTNFGSGGEPHDVINAIRQYGLIPFSAYSGMPQGQTKPVHNEIDEVLKAMLDAMLKLPDGKLNPNWEAAFIGALDGYFGTPPANFTYQGKSYTPQSFAQAMGINPDDYVEITSFTHHPFYTPFILEIADNWANQSVYNVPLQDLKRVVDNAIESNYSVGWAMDDSEKGFSFKNGLAIVPEKNYEDMNQVEKDTMFLRPSPEKEITQANRQEAFDNLSTTDDHGMQIVGIAYDQINKPYYLIKNSWGAEGNDLGGYIYCSVPYFQYKTTAIMVNKHALPKDIAAKLGIKL